jgi:uracil-DNA glycosylase
MYLPKVWQDILSKDFDIESFLTDLEDRVDRATHLIPDQQSVFKLFYLTEPHNVKCVLYGEDPYPRMSSANGIAFWDQELRTWSDKTKGNSLKHIMKALLIHKRLATYSTSIEECREIVKKDVTFPSPDELFVSWINQGVLLLNRSLVFTTKEDKNAHLKYWKNFQVAMMDFFKEQNVPIILWGKKAQSLEKELLKKNYPKELIIKQGHPTYQHHFLNKNDIYYSPFSELSEKTEIKWS